MSLVTKRRSLDTSPAFTAANGKFSEPRAVLASTAARLTRRSNRLWELSSQFPGLFLLGDHMSKWAHEHLLSAQFEKFNFREQNVDIDV